MTDQAHALNLLEDLIAKAKAAGAEAADALVVGSVALSHAQRLGALERLEREESQDLGLRVLIGHQQAVGPVLVEPAGRAHTPGEHREAAGDEGRVGAAGPHGTDQGRGARIDGHVQAERISGTLVGAMGDANFASLTPLPRCLRLEDKVMGNE